MIYVIITEMDANCIGGNTADGGCATYPSVYLTYPAPNPCTFSNGFPTFQLFNPVTCNTCQPLFNATATSPTLADRLLTIN